MVRVLHKLASYQTFEKQFGAAANESAHAVGPDASKEDVKTSAIALTTGLLCNLYFRKLDKDLEDCIIESSINDVAWLRDRCKLQQLKEINK